MVSLTDPAQWKEKGPRGLFASIAICAATAAPPPDAPRWEMESKRMAEAAALRGKRKKIVVVMCRVFRHHLLPLLLREQIALKLCFCAIMFPFWNCRNLYERRLLRGPCLYRPGGN